MNPVMVKRQVWRIAFHPHGVDQSGDTLCNPLREERLDSVVDFLSQLVFIVILPSLVKNAPFMLFIGWSRRNSEQNWTSLRCFPSNQSG